MISNINHQTYKKVSETKTEKNNNKKKKILFMISDISYIIIQKLLKKSKSGFKENLFCANWQYVNTFERSVSYTSLGKK